MGLILLRCWVPICKIWGPKFYFVSCTCCIYLVSVPGRAYLNRPSRHLVLVFWQWLSRKSGYHPHLQWWTLRIQRNGAKEMLCVLLGLALPHQQSLPQNPCIWKNKNVSCVKKAYSSFSIAVLILLYLALSTENPWREEEWVFIL